MKKTLLLAVILILCGCQSIEPSVVTPSASHTVPPTATVTSTASQTPIPTATKTANIPTETPIPFEVCCPLEEETIQSLQRIIVNPLVIPPIGKDDGHHGVDFAYYRRGDRDSIQGIEVYAVLPGTTVLTLEDEIPYGYAILIETPLSYLPQTTQENILATYLPIPDEVVYQGECPAFTAPTPTGEMSVYHLYAHFEERPDYLPGDPIQCGTFLGTVGNSGYSSNPHLHLETRLGPSGVDFSTMAFYKASYTEQQRANYCLWRMSGYYQLFDPFLILSTAE